MRFNIFTSIIIYSIPVVLCILAYKKKNKYYLFAFLIFTFLLAALRFNIASDFGRYYNRAFYRTELGLSFNEPIEMLFFFISSKAGLPRLFFMLNAAVVSICGYILYHQYKDLKRHELMFIAFYFIVLVGTFITRYCAAAAVSSVGIYFLINRSKHKSYIIYYLLIALLSFCFHTGAIVTFAFPILLYIYDLIKRDHGVFKYSYTIVMGIFGVCLPLAVVLGDLVIGNLSIFDKFSLYFNYFKECIPNNIFMIILMLAAICAVGFLFDMISLTFKNKYIQVFSIGSMMFIFFMIVALFQGQYLLDVMRIGVIFAFQSIILFSFAFANKNAMEEHAFTSRIPIYIITSIYICLLVFCVILGSASAVPYNTDTTVPWGSDSTYVQKVIGTVY